MYVIIIYNNQLKYSFIKLLCLHHIVYSVFRANIKTTPAKLKINTTDPKIASGQGVIQFVPSNYRARVIASNWTNFRINVTMKM